MKKSELKNLISEVITEMDYYMHHDALEEALRDPAIKALRNKYNTVIGEDELHDLIAVVWSAAKGKKIKSHYL
jgi:hypothetical protein